MNKKTSITIILLLLFILSIITINHYENNQDPYTKFNEVIKRIPETKEIIITRNNETKRIIYKEKVNQITNILSKSNISSADKQEDHPIYKITLTDINEKRVTKIEIGENIYFDKINKTIDLSEEDYNELLDIIEGIYNGQIEMN